jgi:5-methylthioadenosine/S-adenosylhomocysteine deaminase
MTPPPHPSPSPSPPPSDTPSPSSSPADLVITGCTALVHDEHEGIAFIEDAAIVVRGGTIASIGPQSETAVVATAQRIDARGQVAMPGLINCHTHTPMVALRGIAEDMPAEEWFNDAPPA